MAQHEHMKHLVIPGQLIVASTGDGGEGFLRGHGTYIEGGVDSAVPFLSSESTNNNTPKKKSKREENDDSDEEMEERGDVMEDDNEYLNETSSHYHDPQQPQRLIASVAGTIERVNKLITIHPFAPMPYQGQVGDLVIGRITSVQSSRWKVHLGSACRDASLPLSGINLPGGVQRIRTAQDALEMREWFVEGDLLSAEVQTVQHYDGTIMLHTRSLRYGKLENGCLVVVPAGLIVKRKQHFVTLPVASITSPHLSEQEDAPNVDIILGTNGFIWIQRSTPKSWKDALHSDDGGAVVRLAETFQKLKKRHVETPVLPEERENIARVRNSIEALKLMSCRITPETLMEVFRASVEQNVSVKDMLKPKVVLAITKGTRGEYI